MYAISNRYQITNDWNLSSLKNDNDSKQNFNELFEDTSKSEGVCASDRENRAQQILEQRKGNISLSDMADIMRDVGEDPDNYEPDKAELKQNFVCMHAKPHPDAFWHATGAMITDSNEEGIVVQSDNGPTYKIKPLITLDAVVVGFSEGEGSRQNKMKELLLALNELANSLSLYRFRFFELIKN